MSSFSKVLKVDVEKCGSWPIYHLRLDCGHTKTLTKKTSEKKEYERAEKLKRQKCPECYPVDKTGPKVCIDCEIEKPRDEFYRSKGRRDGYLDRCKLCQKKYSSEIFKNSVPRVPVYDKKKKARNLATEAIVAGLIPQVDACESCNEIKPLQAHHEDYDRPFYIKWLCIRCHSQWHLKYDPVNGDEDPANRYIYAPDLAEILLGVANEGNSGTVKMIIEKLGLTT